MGKVMSMMARKANRFNVENRAHRVLERDKPVPAPRYEANLKDMERALELDPQIVDKLNRRDAGLDTRLKNVYVTSTDKEVQRKDDPDRPLPLVRTTGEDFEFGIKEPQHITPGRCTLRQAMTFITNHAEDPQHWTKERIAEEYKLKDDTVEKILFYYKTFNMYIPDRGQKESILTQAKTKVIEEGEAKSKSN